jgi:hypothetical protein
MIEDIAQVAAWALCGGILVTVILVWLFIYLHLFLMSIKKRLENDA